MRTNMRSVTRQYIFLCIAFAIRLAYFFLGDSEAIADKEPLTRLWTFATTQVLVVLEPAQLLFLWKEGQIFLRARFFLTSTSKLEILLQAIEVLFSSYK